MADQTSGSTELTTKKTENDCENSEADESEDDDDIYEVERIVGISKKDVSLPVFWVKQQLLYPGENGCKDLPLATFAEPCV